MSNQGQGQNHDQAQEALFVIGAFLVVILLIQHFFGTQIAQVYLDLRLYIVKMFLIFMPNNLNLVSAKNAIIQHPAIQWNGKDLSQLSLNLRYFIFPLYAIPFTLYAYKVWHKNPGTKFKRRLDRAGLAKSEVRIWPWISCVMHLDLTNEPIKSGKWKVSLRPQDFAIHYRLLNEDNTLNKLRAEKIFSSQLGPLWSGCGKLNNYSKALYACFIAQLCGSKEDARSGLEKLMVSISDGKPDFNFTEEYLKKYNDNPKVKYFVSKHAYVTTVMCRVLEESRKNGILPPSYFLWLKPVHRSLWYSLNVVGRKVPFVEVGGIFAHYIAEKTADHKIHKPYVENAVIGLERALQEVVIEDWDTKWKT